MTSTGRPFALEPLAEVLGIALHQTGRHEGGGLPPAGATALALVVGVHPRSVRRVAAQGLTFHQADRWAIRAGFHPAEVWLELWWHHAAPDLFPLDHEELSA